MARLTYKQLAAQNEALRSEATTLRLLLESERSTVAYLREKLLQQSPSTSLERKHHGHIPTHP